MTFRSDQQEIALLILTILVITLCLGIILCPYSFLLTEPVSDGRS